MNTLYWSEFGCSEFQFLILPAHHLRKQGRKSAMSLLGKPVPNQDEDYGCGQPEDDAGVGVGRG